MSTLPWLSLEDFPTAEMSSTLGGIALMVVEEEVENENGWVDEEVYGESVASH